RRTRRSMTCTLAGVLSTALTMSIAAGVAQERGVPSTPDLKGWLVEKATVESSDSGILIRASGGWIRTATVYADFTFSADVRLLYGTADAGICVRSGPGFDTAGIPSDGPRFRIDSESPPSDRWRHIDVEVSGEAIRVSLDGTARPEMRAENPQGYVALFVRYGAAEFRNLR